MTFAWRDVLFTLVLVLFLLVNPEEDDEEKRPPGSLVVEAHWADGDSCDVDLWVKAPGERAVGYSNKTEPIMTLLRDDLGSLNDLTPQNYENTYSRGLPDGEYIVAIHLYRCPKPPVEVQVLVSIRRHLRTDQLFTETRTLIQEKQEITIARFDLEDGEILARHDTPLSIVGSSELLP